MMEEPPKNEILQLPAMVGRGAAKKLYHNEKWVRRFPSSEGRDLYREGLGMGGYIMP
jgi:hypothetical protein